MGVLAQTFDDLELVVVDGGSGDGTVDAVRTVADERVRVIEADRGSSVADLATLGRDSARGTWCAVIDADTVARPRWLARVGRLAARGDSTMVLCGGVQHHGDGSSSEVLPADGFTRSGAVVTRRVRDDSPGSVTSTPEALLDWYDGPTEYPDADDERLFRWASDALFTLGSSPIPSADLVARYATVAGMAAARLHRHPDARRMLSVARRVQPTELRPLLRWAVASVPALSDRLFATETH